MRILTLGLAALALATATPALARDNWHDGGHHPRHHRVHPMHMSHAVQHHPGLHRGWDHGRQCDRHGWRQNAFYGHPHRVTYWVPAHPPVNYLSFAWR